jgi:hypothetical protein
VSDKILIDGINFFDEIIKSYESQGRSIEISIVASDALEMEAKSRHLLFVIKDLAGKVDVENSIENLPWAKWNWDTHEERLNSFHERIVIAQVSHLGNLFTWKKPLDFPDYFGKGVILAGEECFKSLKTNNQGIFTKLFPAYLGGILLTSEKLRLNNQDLRFEQILILLTEPIMDLLNLSGYALLYSEFHQNQALWETCKVAWEEIIKANGKVFLERLAFLVRHKKHSFGITKRDISRSQWENGFNSSMKSLIRKPEIIEGRRLPIGLNIIDHPSELIRKIGGTDDFHFSLHNPDEIFIDLFLSKLPDSNELDFGIRYKISESMSRKKSEE